MSPSPRRLGDFKNKKQLSLDSTVGNLTTPTTSSTITEVELTKVSETNGNTNGTTTTDNGGKFENISDNGSEISDEGYRSLGLIQQANNNQSKRASLHSQTSIEDGKTDDAKTNGEFFFICQLFNIIIQKLIKCKKIHAMLFKLLFFVIELVIHLCF